jgi:hypothetical protein
MSHITHDIRLIYDYLHNDWGSDLKLSIDFSSNVWTTGKEQRRAGQKVQFSFERLQEAYSMLRLTLVQGVDAHIGSTGQPKRLL